MPATPFQARRLSVLAYANGQTLWNYTHDGKTTDILEESFFDEGAQMLRAGDLILALVTGGLVQLAVISSRKESAPRVTVEMMSANPGAAQGLAANEE